MSADPKWNFNLNLFAIFYAFLNVAKFNRKYLNKMDKKYLKKIAKTNPK